MSRKLNESEITLMSYSDEPMIRCAAASDPNCPLPVLERLFGDKDQHVRVAVTLNPQWRKHKKQ